MKFLLCFKILSKLIIIDNLTLMFSFFIILLSCLFELSYSYLPLHYSARLKHKYQFSVNSEPISDEPSIRIGHGFDIHRLIEGTKLVIGGVTIPHKLGADAHSDGDALYHRLTLFHLDTRLMQVI